MHLSGGGVEIADLLYMIAVQIDTHLAGDGGVHPDKRAVLFLYVIDAFRVARDIYSLEVSVFHEPLDVQPFDLVEFRVLEESADDEAGATELNGALHRIDDAESHGVAGKLVVVGPKDGVVIHHQQRVLYIVGHGVASSLDVFVEEFGVEIGAH